MDWVYEENVLSILRGRVGWNEEYSSVSEFIQHLDEETALAHEKLNRGCVLWRSNEREQQQQNQIFALLKATAPDSLFSGHYLLQFWGVVKEEGRHHHLSSSHQPFCVGELKKGICWYRKLYRDHVYVVDMEGPDEEQLCCVGRAYRSMQPVSSPDLRLYSTHQFPMRDAAASCGFRAYMALPLFDSHTYQYYGVLEFMYYDDIPNVSTQLLSSFDQALKIAGLRSTHSPIYTRDHTMQEPESEITDIIELAMATVPRLYLAQVWVPCKQCVNINSNLCCMEMAYINPKNRFNWWNDNDMYFYIQACRFYHLKIDVSSCQSNLCDVSISMNPLAHFAQRARVSHCFPISSITNNSHLYVIQFFLQPKFRKDAYNDYSPQLLSRIVEMNLESFKFLEDSQKPNAVDSGSIDSLNILNSYEEEFSVSNFTAYLEVVADSCCLRPPSDNSGQGWVFCLPTTERLCENDVKSNSLLIKEKIENFMKSMAVRHMDHCKGIIQFWAPKMEEDRCYLEAFYQPYAVGCLAKGIAYFRKKCMTHYYRMDEAAKEEELGPPGRVFRNGYPEISPDLFHYTEKEFLIRNYAMHCLCRRYFALPIFDDEHNHMCVGVLEFLDFHYFDLEDIGRELEVANLCWTQIGFHPRFLVNEPQPFNSGQILCEKHPSFLERSKNVEISLQPDIEPNETMYCRTNPLTEINNALEVILNKIPQFHMANVWVPDAEYFGISSNTSCMKLALSTNSLGHFMPTDQVYWIHVQTGKGMVGMVLQSESKSCFCRNLCEFSIVDQPLSHFEMSDRRNVCFGICLQSSHTGDLVYVLEFFLYQGPSTCEYVRSFLNFLLPIMKNELKSFKMASGKQLGEELVVEVIEFSEADKHDSSESEQVDVFPIKFKSVQYGQKEHQHMEEQQMEECNMPTMNNELESFMMASEKQLVEELVVEVIEFSETDKLDSSESEQVDVFPIKFKSVQDSQKEHRHTEEQQKEECNFVASDSKKRERGKGKTGLHLSLELLQPYFGKKLKDVAEELGVGRSTIKRACRDYGIDRWPSTEKQKKNLSLFGGESGGVSQQETNTESSHHLNVKEEAEKVIIKVKHEPDIVKFEFCLSLGLTKLIEEAATRLNLEIGSFKLKYLDEDDDEILLTRDDLHLCPKSQRAGQTCIQLFVR